MTSKLRLCLILSLLFSISTFAQHKAAYKLVDQNGKEIAYQEMIETLKDVDVVLFGEFHDNPISHWLQYEVVKSLHDENINIKLGAEMFEADQQEALNAYLSDEFSAKQLQDSIKLWPNYKTDYKPLVDFAKTNSLEFIATNIPRRFASDVYKKGGFKALDELSSKQKSWIAPMPVPFDIELRSYQDMLKMMGDHGGVDIVKAQAIKDATMAHFILKDLLPNEVFIHFNGSYHSNYFEGIFWYLKQYREEVRIKTITTVEQQQLKKLDEKNKNLADYVIIVDENMTKTY
ncbi:iron-regulated protein [Psychroflexus sp. S27]|uniref:ChaN family lipoprotein n=1 Tax=Psychroflexus sp. S27 TaxID=1982757 RepID=UPI000C2AD236|nr:ChaN family lipoprotein [Psychroflexus sp. S27]PJX21534.1 iron-regulated protein [Psychroflexus sp. S27]